MEIFLELEELKAFERPEAALKEQGLHGKHHNASV